MSDTFPFDPARLAALGRLAAKINAASAPPPITEPVIVNEHGWATIPVPHHDAPIVADLPLRGARRLVRHVSAQVHAGLTLQWVPVPEQDGLLLSLWGGSPDGDADKDAVLAFVTRRGLKAIIADLQAIAATLESA